MPSYGGFFDPESLRVLLQERENELSDPGFWQRSPESQRPVIDAVKVLRERVATWDCLVRQWEDAEVLQTLVGEEGGIELQDEWASTVEKLWSNLESFSMTLLLSGPYDRYSAFVELHPGAGGVESQDWAAMLLRMYTRWAERVGYQSEILSLLPGGEAGIKGVTLRFQGSYAYGRLQTERGVHRLVRISPFDASGRRHTSFASVTVMPELPPEEAVEVQTADLKIDTYRASGAGGQHINTTDSAVRITHIPTGLVVTCQSERSQIQNRERAIKVLQARLTAHREEERQREREDLQGEKVGIDFGSQIRSYVLHPYQMVKDHRTQYETGNVQAVLDGDLDSCIAAALRWQLDQSKK